MMMNKRRVVAVLWLVVMVCSLYGFPEVRLEDQFRGAHTPETLFEGKLLVLIGGDQRRTDGHIRAWAERLAQVCANGARIVGLTNLRGLPFFVSKNSVRSSLKKNLPGVPVLTDWSGTGYKQFGFIRGQVNLHVYSPDRQLVASFTGTLTEELAQNVVAVIERALSKPREKVGN
jgi:hypothetical protein